MSKCVICKGIAMRKFKHTLAALFMGICAMIFSSCTANKSEDPPISVSVSESEFTNFVSSVNQSKTTSTKTSEINQTSSVEEISEPEKYIWNPRFDTGMHDFSTGNVIYNSNVNYYVNRQYGANLHRDNTPAVLWTGMADLTEHPFSSEKIVEYANSHWNNGVGLCAQFASECLNAGGINIYSTSSTALALKLLHSNMGFGQFIPVNSDRTVTLPEYAVPGDIVQYFCKYDGMPHTIVYTGNDENGNMKGCSHNPDVDGKNPYKIENHCFDCGTSIDEVFYFHFGNESNENLPAIENGSRIMLYEAQGAKLAMNYNRENALSYAKNHPSDGIGEFGAISTSNALMAGGIPIEHSFQSALFFQLIKSRLGTAQSIAVNHNQTVTLPEYARAGDVGFIYCRNDGIILSSFIIDGVDEKSKMIALSYDNVNNGTSAFLTDEICPGCGGAIDEVILFHFN